MLCMETYAQVRALQLATTNVTERPKVADLRSVGWKRPHGFKSHRWYFSSGVMVAHGPLKPETEVRFLAGELKSQF